MSAMKPPEPALAPIVPFVTTAFPRRRQAPPVRSASPLTVPFSTPLAVVSENVPATVLGEVLPAPRVTVTFNVADVTACGAPAFTVIVSGASGAPEKIHVVPTAGDVDSDAAPDPVGFDCATFVESVIRCRTPYDSKVLGVVRPERLTPPTAETPCWLALKTTHTGALAPGERDMPSASLTYRPLVITSSSLSNCVAALSA